MLVSPCSFSQFIMEEMVSPPSYRLKASSTNGAVSGSIWKCCSFSYENSSEAKGQLRGIDLHVKKGELVILSGRSGCGKTTLTRILNGLCPGFYPGKLEGGYSLDGEDALKMPIHRLGTMVGSVFQDPRSQFFATNTTNEIVLGMENIPLERPFMQERLNTVCKHMNIERLIGRRIFPLSSGEKQLIAIASVCAMEPKVIVLDEPSANLDSEAMVRLGALLYRLKTAGHTIILSEHRFHYVRDSFDRLVFMEDGAISAVYDRKDALSLRYGIFLNINMFTSLPRSAAPEVFRPRP